MGGNESTSLPGNCKSTKLVELLFTDKIGDIFMNNNPCPAQIALIAANVWGRFWDMFGEHLGTFGEHLRTFEEHLRNILGTCWEMFRTNLNKFEKL